MSDACSGRSVLQRVACGKPNHLSDVGNDRACGFAAWAALHDDVGLFDDFAAGQRPRQSDRLDGCRSAAGEPHAAAAGGAGRDVERSVEAAAARVIGGAVDAQVAARIRLHVDGAQLAIENKTDIVRIAEGELPGQRLCDAVFDFLRPDRAAGAGHHDFAEAAGIETEQRVCPHRLDHRVGRDRPGRAEIGRAENRHLGDDAGVIDQIADAHHVPGDDRFGSQHRMLLVDGGGDLRQCGRNEREKHRDGKRE